MRPARREKGRLCSQTFPGPRSWAKKKPSPPKTIDLTEPARTMSNSTDGAMAARQPGSTCSSSPAASSRSMMVPPAWMKTHPSPSRRCMTKPWPPKIPAPILRWKWMPTLTPLAAQRKASRWAIMVPPMSERWNGMMCAGIRGGEGDAGFALALVGEDGHEQAFAGDQAFAGGGDFSEEARCRVWSRRRRRCRCEIAASLNIMAPASAMALSPGSSSISTNCISSPLIS